MSGHHQGKQLKMNLQIIKTLYGGVDGTGISRGERARLNIQNEEFTYGEVEPTSFISILDSVKPQVNEVFYDLGCGTGKAVYVAALCFEFSKICGIELLPGLYTVASNQIDHLRRIVAVHGAKTSREYQEKIARIEFINDDILNCDISDADIIFINATCFYPQTWEAILQKFNELKVGARVITTTKKINDEHFHNLYQTQYLMSWGMNTVNAYIKVK